MASLNLEDMQQIQKELQAKYLEKWGGLSPKIGRDKLLWMMPTSSRKRVTMRF